VCFPAAATFLLRNIVETMLKHIIDDQHGNKTGKRIRASGINAVSRQMKEAAN
jgi:hypothetical protein